MNNLISIFMNYKINRLVEYSVFLLDDDSDFYRKVLHEYLSVYIDNYYYGIFYTLENASYSKENLEKEFQGIMKEMLDDYTQYELSESNEEYSFHVNSIRELKDFSLEIVLLDHLIIHNKDEIIPVITEFVESHIFFSEKVGNRINKFIKLIRETYQTCQKLLHYEDHYFTVLKNSFVDYSEICFCNLEAHINILHNYRRTMVSRVYKEEGLDKRKFECIVQKISLEILRGVINNRELSTFIIPFSDSFIKRGKINDEILDFIDNPLFRHYALLGVSFSTYLNQKKAFLEDYHFACIQDFSHINDIYGKVESISNEGIFDYIVVSDCKYKDREFFLKYESDAIKLLVFEEE